MRFLIDECLHESLVGVAHGAGFEATHVNHLGLSGKPDWELAERIVKDEFTFVTNNRVDFIRPFRQNGVARWPNRNQFRISLQLCSAACFEAAIQYLAGKSLINAVIEVTSDGKTATCFEYRLPAD